jgi:asparagine synthase (glutamine-hydrolysing)
MCGLFGHTGVKASNVEQAHAALHTLTHRGPDGWGYELMDGVYLGHRRLSILDLSEKGRQPMVKEGVALTVNGEIYNFGPLRAELEKTHQARFESESDSEVLLHGYLHWGLDLLLEKVDGMFAFVIYDSRKKQVILARDHAGIKPLYYSWREGQLGWASELKALEAYYGPPALEVDKTAVYDFLTYTYIPAPKSLYRDIFKLPPAHYAVFDVEQKTLSQKCYWRLPVDRSITDEAEAGQKIKASLAAAVQAQTISDVPLGAFLSGGVDSSIICYEASQVIEQLTTCTIAMADPAVDESAYARMVADAIGSDHKVGPGGHIQAAGQRDLLKTLFDEPFGDTSAFPTYAVSKIARQHMTVVLTGDGGDELFGGYEDYTTWYKQLRTEVGFLFPLRPLVTWVKNHSRGALYRLARKVEIFTIRDPLERMIRLRGCLLATDRQKQEFRARLGIPADYDDLWHLRPFYRADLPPRSRAQYLGFHTTLPEDMLTKVDRASMAHGLEARVPFLSKDVIRVAWQVSEDLLYKGGALKGLLKSLYADVLPRACLYRKKQGFAIGQAKGEEALFAPGQPVSVQVLRRVFPHLLEEV